MMKIRFPSHRLLSASLEGHTLRNFLRPTALVLAALMVGGFATSGGVAAASAAGDTSPPHVVSFDVSPTQYYEADLPATTTVRARIVDVGVGVASPSMQFEMREPMGSGGMGEPMTLTSGDSHDGVYEWTGEVVGYHPQAVQEFSLYDLQDLEGNKGNAPVHRVTVLAGAHPDAPSVPTGVSAAAGDRQVEVMWNAPEDPGSEQISSYVVSSSQHAEPIEVSPAARSVVVTGLANGIAYDFDVVARNAAGSSMPSTAPGPFVPVGPLDVTPPRVESLTATPGSVYLAEGKAEITITAHLVDSESPIDSPVITVASPVDALGNSDYSYSARLDLISGNQLDGVYGTTVPMELGSIAGDMTATFRDLADVVGNTMAAGSAPAAVIKVLPPAGSTVPGAPRNGTVSTHFEAADVAWEAPATDGGTPITGYRVVATPGGKIISVGADENRVWFGALTPGISYSFKVFANNVLGDSTPLTLGPVTVQGRPEPPRDVVATANAGSVILTWSAPSSDNGSHLTGYQIRRNGSYLATVEPDQRRYEAFGLQNGTEYSFTVVAVNVWGSTAAEPVRAKPGAAPSAPRILQDLSISTDNPRSLVDVTVQWMPSVDSGGSEILEYRLSISPGDEVVTVPADASFGGRLEATLHQLRWGETYTLYVTSVNAVGTSTSSRSFTPMTRPDSPENVQADAGVRRATVSWDEPVADGGSNIIGYRVVAHDSRGQAGTVNVEPHERSAVIDGLQDGMPYTFTVAARNGSGYSLPSVRTTTVSTATVPSAPTGLEAVPGAESIAVSWEAPASDGGAPIASYLVLVSEGQSISVPATDRSVVVADLRPGSHYSITVAAVNEVGESLAADVATHTLERLNRFAGGNRFETAAAVAEQFPVGVETVYLASGTNFPDALAGAALAGSTDSPILLALRNGVPESTMDAIRRLQPQNIVLLGGEPTLSAAVEQQLRGHGTVSRIAGVDRYATAAAISSRFQGDTEVVYIASGQNFPDALAGAAVAGAMGAPVLLTAPTTLRQSVRDALKKLDPRRIVVLGGTPSVSAFVEAELAGIAPVERIAGGNRFETAALIAAPLSDVDRVFVASGLNFPDALAGAALAAAQGAPVLLSRPERVPVVTGLAVRQLAPEQIVVLGDGNAVSHATATALVGLIE